MAHGVAARNINQRLTSSPLSDRIVAGSGSAPVLRPLRRIPNYQRHYVTLLTPLILNHATAGLDVADPCVHCMNKVVRCKIGAALVSIPRARPRSCVPHPPKMLDLGRGRHFFNKLWLTVGRVLRPENFFALARLYATLDRWDSVTQARSLRSSPD
jgi:hypothetical protein